MSYLDIDTQHKLRITLKSIIGESIAILGIKGSGKTNTAAVVIEEMLANGLPLTIVDIEGEYWGLKEKFEIYVIGRSANVDIPVSVSHAGYFAEFSITHGLSLILDLSDFDQRETHEFLFEYFTALWKAAFKARRPYQIVLEEAHEFVPQTVRTPLKEVLTRIALRGRKRGLGIISVSQRSAKVEKDILTQAGMVFLHRVVHPIDIRVYQDILPLPAREVESGINALRPGDAFVMVENTVQQVHIRQRHTFHVGSTPELQTVRQPRLRQMDSELLKELKKLTEQAALKSNANETNGKFRQLETQLALKDQQISDQQRQIETLQSQVDLLSKLELKVIDQTTREKRSPNSIERLAVDELLAAKLVAPNSGREELQSKLIIAQKETALDATQEKRFTHLLSDLGQLPRFQRTMLAFLTERPEKAFTIAELARWLHISVTTLENKPPLDLIKMGLIVRKGARGKYYYESSARNQLARMFSDLETNLLIDRLLQYLRQH